MSVQLLTVTEDEGEQRLDKWLRRRAGQGLGSCRAGAAGPRAAPA
jgi:hypothetical protein